MEDLHTNSTEEPEVGQVCVTNVHIILQTVKNVVLQGSYLQVNLALQRVCNHQTNPHCICTHAHTDI